MSLKHAVTSSIVLSRDVRRELTKLSYTHDEIEGDFIPLLILRSHVDVAHPIVAIHSEKQLKIIYRYLSSSEDRLRELLKRVIERVEAGIYEVLPAEVLTLDDEVKRGMDELVNVMKSRLILHQNASDSR